MQRKKSRLILYHSNPGSNSTLWCVAYCICRYILSPSECRFLEFALSVLDSHWSMLRNQDNVRVEFLACAWEEE